MRAMLATTILIAASLALPLSTTAGACNDFFITSHYETPRHEVKPQVTVASPCLGGQEVNLITPEADAVVLFYYDDIPGAPFDVYAQFFGLGWNGERVRLVWCCEDLDHYESFPIPIRSSATGTFTAILELPDGSKVTSSALKPL